MNSQEAPKVFTQEDLDSLIEDYKNMFETYIVFEKRLPDDDPSPDKWTIKISRKDDGTHLGAFDFERSCKDPLSTYERLSEAYDLVNELRDVLFDSNNDELCGLYVAGFCVADAFNSINGESDNQSSKLEITLCDAREYNKCRNFYYSAEEMDWVCQNDNKAITLGGIVDEREAMTILAKNLLNLYCECGIHIGVCPEKGFQVTGGYPKIPARYKGEYKELTVENVRKLFKDIGYVAQE